MYHANTGPIAALESKLAAAHRCVWSAANQAEALADQGLADDLHAIAMEIRRCTEALLKSNARLRTRPHVRA